MIQGQLTKMPEPQAVENMAIWKAVFKTDSRFTKNFKRGGGFSGTDINSTYRMAVMTELFGPCGMGWGWLIEDRWSESIDGRGFAFVQAVIWYRIDGEVYTTGPQIGGTEYGRAPDEAYKMAVTDAIGKCMTSLGLSADIYMKQYDSKYQREDMYVGQEQAKPAEVYDYQMISELVAKAESPEQLSFVRERALKMQPPKEDFDKLKELFDGKKEKLAIA